MTSLDMAPVQARTLGETLTRPHVAALIFAALVGLMALPALVFPVPRGNDIVDHWARLTLYGMPADDPLAALYRLRFGLTPNLGLDALYLALSPLVSPQSAARLALALAIALPAGGAFALHRALFAKPSPTIWFVPFLSYNTVTTCGLLNFALGIGLAFFGLAAILRRGDRWRAADYAGLNLLGAALFFCHLIAWAAFALLLGLIRVQTAPRAIARRALGVLAAQALPLALVALREAPPSTYALGGSKMAVMFAPVATMTAADLSALMMLLALVGLALANGVRPAASMRLALAGFAAFAAFVPSAHGAANLIDARLAVYAWYFAIAVSALPERDARVAPAALLAVLLAASRLAVVWPAFAAFQTEAAEARAGLAALPRGARALVVAPQACGSPDLFMFENLTAFAVIDRRAYVNTLFAQSGIQPVAPADPALDGGPTLAMDPRWLSEAGRASLPAYMLKAPWATAFRDWRRHFTHVIDAHRGCAPSVHEPGLTRIGGAAGLDIYRID